MEKMGQASNYNPRWRHRKPGLSSVPFQNNACTAGLMFGLVLYFKMFRALSSTSLSMTFPILLRFPSSSLLSKGIVLSSIIFLLGN